LRFALRRAGAALATLLLVSVFGFLAFSVVRGDPVTFALGLDATDEQIAAMRAETGLDRSLPVRYASWLARFVTGNMGYSLRFPGESVAGLIRERLPVSLTLAVMSLAIAAAIAVPASLFSVRRRGGPADRITGVLTAVGISIPNFFLGVLFIWIFGIGLRMFGVAVQIGPGDGIARIAAALFFPALAVAVPNAAILANFLRASLFKEQTADYFRTARGKGATMRQAIRRHALRNALIPAVTVTAMIVAETFSGSIIIEQVFAVPGLGRLLVTAITSRDYPVVQALVVLIAAAVVAANTLADIAIRIIDPRIRLGAEQGG